MRHGKVSVEVLTNGEARLAIVKPSTARAQSQRLRD
jgi:hypothetical protein